MLFAHFIFGIRQYNKYVYKTVISALVIEMLNTALISVVVLVGMLVEMRMKDGTWVENFLISNCFIFPYCIAWT